MFGTLWSVDFMSNAQITGAGVVVFLNNEILGGDNKYYYTGKYIVDNEIISGEIEAIHYFGNPLSAFGPSKSFTIQVSGKIGRPVMKLKGYLTDDPTKSLDINCTQRAGSILNQDREGIFFENQYYSAQHIFSNIVSGAQQRIVIIDNYFNRNVLDQLSVKSKNIEVNVLTKSIQPDTRQAAISFNKQYGNLSIKTKDTFHDRFIIVDDKLFYHFGASLKDVGKRIFMYSLIEEQDITNSLKDKFYREWSTAKVEV